MTDSSVAGMVLSAGLGTRLQALGLERPKALFPLCNVPLAHWALSLLRHHRIAEVTLNLHHLGQQLRELLGDGESLGMKLSYSVEQTLLGTGGGIKAMAALGSRRTVVVVNGKLATDVDLDAVLAAHRRAGALATMVLYPQENAAAWGAVGLDSSRRVVRLLDTREAPAGAVEDFMFTGIHVLEPELIDTIPTGACCIIRTAYREAVARGAPIFGFVHRGYFYEHSTPARYLQGNFNLLGGAVALPAAPGPLGGVDERAELAANAKIIPPVLVGAARIGAGARVGPFAVIGAGAEVHSAVQVRQSIVWPGAAVTHSCERAIVSTGQTLQVEPCRDPMLAPR